MNILRLLSMVPLGIALVLSGIAPVCGQTISFLRELSFQYQQTIGVAVDATGVYTVGWEGADYHSAVGLVRKHDARGNELWARRLENNSLSGVAVDAAGGVYVVGAGFVTERDAFISKLSSEGNLLWTRQVGLGGGAVVATGNSGVYMAWTPAEGPQRAVVIRKYAAEGDMLWTARPVFSPTSLEFPMAVPSKGVTGLGGAGMSTEGFVRNPRRLQVADRRQTRSGRLEAATSSLGSNTCVESKSLARVCCDFLNLQPPAKSAFARFAILFEA